MIGYILRRLAVTVILLFVLSAITFWIYLKVPADPAGFLVDIQHASPAEIADAPTSSARTGRSTAQHGDFVWRALHGDFGISWQTICSTSAAHRPGSKSASSSGMPPRHGLARPRRLVLMLLVAIPLGVYVATKPRSFADRLSVGLCIAAISTHPLVVGLLLQLFVGNKWKLLPASGYCTTEKPSKEALEAWQRFAPTGAPAPCGGYAEWAQHLILPWLTFALFFVALYMRIVRTRMLEVLDEPFVRTARAKGASEFRVIRSHALRNAVAPIVTMAAMDAAWQSGSRCHRDGLRPARPRPDDDPCARGFRATTCR